MKRIVLATAALAAAVVVFAVSSLPPAPLVLDRPWDDGTVAGVLHIHTIRADGRSAPEEIAAIAARAGLRFLVFTDHGDATREPDPPAYYSGVLCLDAVEISTTGGHYAALGLGAAPYPLAGESRDVVDDVRRLGGFGIATHPDSPKTGLAWTDWGVPIDGLELLNLDTGWRVHLVGGWTARLPLVTALFTYPVRPGGTVANLLTPSPALAATWQTLTAERAVVGLAGADAHAKLELRDEEPGAGSLSLPIPGYESSLRALSIHVTPDEPLTGDAAADARRLLGGIRRGRLFTAVDAWASPPAFRFTVENRNGAAGVGDQLTAGGPATLHVRSNAPQGYVTVLWRNGDVVLEDADHRDLDVGQPDGPAVYRVEIRSPGNPGRPAWLTSNPIYVRAASAPRKPEAEPTPSTLQRLSLFDGRSAAGWSTEADPTSVVALDAVQMIAATELRIRYGLSGGARAGQFAGAAVETRSGIAPYGRLAFTARSEQPMRVSIQVRAAVPGSPPERWQRSIVVDTTDGEHVVRLDDMRPVGTTHTERAVPADVRSVLFVVDTTNARPGASGRIWIKNVRLEP